MVAGAGGLLLGAAAARAQDNASAPPANPPSQATIGPPQLRDFSLQPRQRIVTQPAPAPVQPPVIAPPPPVTAGRQGTTPPRAAPARPAAETARPAPAAPVPAPQQAAPAPAPGEGAPQPQAVPAAPLPAPAPAPAPAQPASGGFPWLYVLPAVLLALIAFALFRRRRRSAEIGEAVEAAAPELPARAAVGARPEPLPRPWLELELKAERLASTDAESLVQFELEITNSGEAPARNLRIDVKMFNAGEEQDKEIGAFFRTAGRESTKCSLPGIAPGTTGAIRGEVAMPRAEMRAVVLENKYLFIPVIAVNALYDWGDGRTGQTSKSYVVGRELEQPSDKMGAFRVDLGPRVWRTVGQRQHKLARRV